MTPPATRRYLVRFGISMAAYVAVLVAADWTFRHHPPQGAFRYVLAVAPAAPILGVIWAMGRYLLEETDEYLRMRQVRTALLATGLTLAACTAWGFLETYAGVSRAPLYMVFVVYCVCLGLLQGVQKAMGRS